MLSSKDVSARGVRISWTDEAGVEAGHAYLYLMRNDLHERPFGLLEDVAVSEAHRAGGIGNALVKAVIEKAKAEGCYKLLATSRNDGTRQLVHDWYGRLGFANYGTEFRMNL